MTMSNGAVGHLGTDVSADISVCVHGNERTFPGELPPAPAAKALFV